MPRRNFSTLPHKSPNVHAVLRDGTEIWRTYLMSLCQAFYECCCWCCVFAGNVGSLKTQISQNTEKPKYLAKKERKTYYKARLGHIKHVPKISGFNSQKRHQDWTLTEFGVSCLNQPVSVLLTRHILWQHNLNIIRELMPQPITYPSSITTRSGGPHPVLLSILFRVFEENLVGSGFLLSGFLCEAYPNPPKKYLLWEDVAR